MSRLTTTRMRSPRGSALWDPAKTKWTDDNTDGLRTCDFIGSTIRLTKGSFEYDFGDTAETTPLIEMFTLGHTFVPPPIHAGGLRYHGDAPSLCRLVKDGVIEAVAYPQSKVFVSAVQFARAEGIIPAPESAHAIRVVIDEAKKCTEAGRGKAILFNLSGHGHFDLSAYEAFLTGKLQDYEYPSAKVEEALRHLPKVKA